MPVVRAKIRKDTYVVVGGRIAFMIARGSVVSILYPPTGPFKVYLKGDKLFVKRRKDKKQVTPESS
jgi:hypothetical protein